MKQKIPHNLPNRHAFLQWAIVLLLTFQVYPGETAEPVSIRNDINTTGEYELKAIYLYNFLKFVRWPDNRCLLHEGRSHHITVLGESPFNEVLTTLQEKLKESNQELELTFYGPYQEDIHLEDCCLLFISESENANAGQILDSLAGKPVLTVTDSDMFPEQGVMITLLSRKNKIRWAINRQPVRKSGLNISSKLLDMAVEIID